VWGGVFVVFFLFVFLGFVGVGFWCGLFLVGFGVSFCFFFFLCGWGFGVFVVYSCRGVPMNVFFFSLASAVRKLDRPLYPPLRMRIDAGFFASVKFVSFPKSYSL